MPCPLLLQYARTHPSKLGCSKCRYSAAGCRKCRADLANTLSPTAPRTAARRRSSAAAHGLKTPAAAAAAAADAGGLQQGRQRRRQQAQQQQQEEQEEEEGPEEGGQQQQQQEGEDVGLPTQSLDSKQAAEAGSPSAAGRRSAGLTPGVGLCHGACTLLLSPVCD